MTSTDARGTQSVTPVQQPDEPESLLVGPEADVDPTVSVVMPTMNEEEGVAECIDLVKAAVRRSGYRTEVVISDDSTDRTPDIAREEGAVVVEPDEPGYGYAYRYAFARCRGEYIIIGDADTTYDFEQFPRLLKQVVEGDADMVMGSRLEGDIKDGAMPALHEHVGNPLLTKFLNVFYGAGVSDAHSGFRAFHADVLDELDLETTGMEFASEMIMDAGARDLTIKEIPITYHEREGEATLESFRDGWRHVRFMLLNAPNYLFSLPGAVLGITGLSLLLSGTTGVSLGGVSLGTTAAITGSLLVLVGYQAANMGVFATLASDPIQRPNDVVTETVIQRMNLERLSTVGLVGFTAGALYLTWGAIGWATGNVALVAATPGHVIALTVMILGIQTVFNAFFMSAVDDRVSAA
ncbi:glycosyltransferase family 2 protein [Halorubrum sp. CGM5_25_10-8B]|uniref:glycosyltransferase family 2 protein n=1 Tax=Halorubrum sp. CGM5_25_10-8B TaxID=2518115 RepID=UPI0023B93E26|nr:glycosyltransferase family 2 protein [Halorubrum sp. CGM5_25_10-8B]